MSSRSGWSSSTFSSSRSMASSRSLSSRSGSYTVARSLTTLALDALKLALDGGEIKQEGDHFIHLQSELGDRRYRKLCEDGDLALKEIHYCQEGLDIARINGRGDQGQEIVSQEQIEEMRQMKDLINHDYLVLKIQPGEPNAEVLHIMAHKLRGGIHVTHIPSSDVTSVFHEGVRCFTVDCDKEEKKRIRLWTLIAILKVEDPDYSLRNANCWNYAKNTAKRLVKECIEVGGISSVEKARLQKEHDNLEANLAFRHMHNIAKSLLRRVSSRAVNPSRVTNSSRTLDSFGVVERPSPPRALTALNLSARGSNTSRILDSHRAVELSSPPSPQTTPTALNLSMASNSSEILNSARVMELSSPPTDAASAPLASSGKICLQIVFLMFWLIINNLGLGPWARSLLGGTNSG